MPAWMETGIGTDYFARIALCRKGPDGRHARVNLVYVNLMANPIDGLQAGVGNRCLAPCAVTPERLVR